MTSIVYTGIHLENRSNVHGHLFEEEKTKRVVEITCGPASSSREKDF